jgi:hypothetical protein
MNCRIKFKWAHLHAMKTYGEMKVDLHSFLILELNGVEWSALSPRFLPSEALPPLLKAIPLQALAVSAVGGSHIWRLSAHEGGKFVSSRHRPPLPPRKCSWHSFLLEAESILGHSAPEGLSLWNINTPWGIDLATFQLSVQCLNQLRHRVSQSSQREE